MKRWTISGCSNPDASVPVAHYHCDLVTELGSSWWVLNSVTEFHK